MVTTRVSNDGLTTYYPFPCSRELEHIENLVVEALQIAMSRIAEEVDPNWLELEVEFQGNGLTPMRAVLNGPLHGNVDLLAHERMKDPDIQRLLMHHGVSMEESELFQLSNVRHRIELIPGRTQLVYEHCEIGVVYSVESDGRFTVFITEGRTNSLCEENLEELRSNLKLEQPGPEADEDCPDYWYLTFTSIHYLNKPVAMPGREELQLETQEIREASRRSWEKYQFDFLRRNEDDW